MKLAWASIALLAGCEAKFSYQLEVTPNYAAIKQGGTVLVLDLKSRQQVTDSSRRANSIYVFNPPLKPVDTLSSVKFLYREALYDCTAGTLKLSQAAVISDEGEPLIVSGEQLAILPTAPFDQEINLICDPQAELEDPQPSDEV